MADERFLIVKLSSLGDIIHALPVLAALRDTFLRARIDWLVDKRWQPLLQGNPDLNETLVLNGSSVREFFRCGKHLHGETYTAVIDVQSLYRSAILAWRANAGQHIGFSWSVAREHAASLFYSIKVKATAAHIVDQNLALAHAAGARPAPVRFPIFVSSDSQATIDQLLRSSSIERYILLSPGGGWRYKRWPPERFGELAEKLWNAHHYRIIVNCGPGESDLGEIVLGHAGIAMPIMVQYELPELKALLMRADLVVACDSGPLHLAAALGTPVVGLYGPTDPARNGPYGGRDIVIRHASDEDTTHDREDSDSESMLAITVNEVLAAVEERLAKKAQDVALENAKRAPIHGSGSVQ
ncbi:MAG TPA: glycosyltransferase family 9 protein [Candidatus Acidoferrales bacterium]|nr:glycosyltransferase family 9 protein [Candidatus Acidoferrales bacterium]